MVGGGRVHGGDKVGGDTDGGRDQGGVAGFIPKIHQQSTTMRCLHFMSEQLRSRSRPSRTIKPHVVNLFLTEPILPTFYDRADLCMVGVGRKFQVYNVGLHDARP